MQKNESQKQTYQYRLNQVVEYINNNLDKEMDLAALAKISHFSPYHFHRLFRGMMGEPVGAFIVRTRVETAARLIRYTSLSIEEICYKVGYNVPSSLTKVFKQFYGISPTEYRNNKNYVIMRPEKTNETLNIKGPKFITLKPKQAIYVRLAGEYSQLDFGGAWQRLWAYVKENKLFSFTGMEHIAIYHNDPKITESDKLLTDVCLTISKQVKPGGEIGVKEIPGGDYAVFTYTGSYEHLSSLYDWVYGQWLPESGYELGESSGFELYLNNPADTKPEKLKTELYLPVKKV